MEFTFYAPTRIVFGENAIQRLGELVRQYTDSLLLVYGKGSIKRTGIYQAVTGELENHGVRFIELAGVDPNPRLSTVQAGADLCRQHGLGFVLAVGGGSAIDCAKAIAAAALYDGDPWDFWAAKKIITAALPLGSVLTVAATGTEMNNVSVISNEATLEKRGVRNEALFPKFSLLDPTYTYTVSREQTAAGVVDSMSHVFEYYFGPLKTAYLQDALGEAVLKTCIRYGPIAYREPENFEARANLMWASTMAFNGVAYAGKVWDGFNHSVEHGFSAIYDITHGVGLAILIPHWMAYVLGDETVGKLAAYARNVWGVNGAQEYEVARQGIQKTRDFFTSLGMPDRLSQVGIGSDRFAEVIDHAAPDGVIGHFKTLTREEVMQILTNAQ